MFLKNKMRLPQLKVNKNSFYTCKTQEKRAGICLLSGNSS